MAANRQDAWTADEDLLLAEVTLRHIREGGTQLAAFEEVAERLGRTAAACGFRWNSTIRKEYEEAISIAKGVRKKRGKRSKGEAGTYISEESHPPSLHFPVVIDASGSYLPPDSEQKSITFEEVFRFLIGLQESRRKSLEELFQLKKRVEDLEQENGQLLAENEKLQRELERTLSLEEDYKALLEMMERAKRKTSHQKEEGSY
ncbi:MAG: RsfA family transcriptional regulator [Thermicanus sp.]|nr:RsfA family transcriptional regulator [Thermicanus sp.]